MIARIVTVKDNSMVTPCVTTPLGALGVDPQYLDFICMPHNTKRHEKGNKIQVLNNNKTAKHIEFICRAIFQSLQLLTALGAIVSCKEQN